VCVCINYLKSKSLICDANSPFVGDDTKKGKLLSVILRINGTCQIQVNIVKNEDYNMFCVDLERIYSRLAMQHFIRHETLLHHESSASILDDLLQLEVRRDMISREIAGVLCLEF
jgi:hypothetical protein